MPLPGSLQGHEATPYYAPLSFWAPELVLKKNRTDNEFGAHLSALCLFTIRTSNLYSCLGLKSPFRQLFLTKTSYSHLGAVGEEIYSSALSSLSFLFFPGPPCCFHWGPLAVRCLVAPICDFVQQLWSPGGYPKVICGCRLFDDFFSVVVPLEEGRLSESWVVCSV